MKQDLLEVITGIADDLYHGSTHAACPGNTAWKEKYLPMTGRQKG